MRPRAPRALTLFEVIVSISLMGLIVGALLIFMRQVAQAREQAGRMAAQTQIARQVLDRIASELRGCVGSEELGFPVEQRLKGTRRSITFLTTALPGEEQYVFYGEFDRPPAARHDLRLITYDLRCSDRETTESGDPVCFGIVRTEKTTLNQYVVNEDDPLEMRADLWAPELKYLELRYYDGVEWDTKWDVTEGNSLPQLVQVTVGFEPIRREEWEDSDLQRYPVSDYPLGDDQVHPDRYSVIVRMPAADRLFGSRVQRVGKQLAEQLGVGGMP